MLFDIHYMLGNFLSHTHTYIQAHTHVHMYSHIHIFI